MNQPEMTPKEIIILILVLLFMFWVASDPSDVDDSDHFSTTPIGLSLP